MVDVLERLLELRPEGTFIDVGMNLGQTLLAVKALDPHRPYVGFEPNPQSFAYADRLIPLNNLSDVSLIPIGLSSATGLAQLQFYSASLTDSSASLVEGFRPGQNIFAAKLVPVFSFADVRSALGVVEIAIVKIDVEGSEWDVLHSMHPALSASRPFVVIEILPCYDATHVERLHRQQCIELLAAQVDYELLRIVKGPKARLAYFERISTIGIHGDVSMCDYVLCPSEEIPRVMQKSA